MIVNVMTYSQIFEWCHMIMSGKCASLVTDNDVPDTKGVMQELPGDVHALLVETYKNIVPRYSELLVKYQEELRKAANQR